MNPLWLNGTTEVADLHRDPFDRILVAQAVAEGWALISSDRQIGAYPVRIVW